MDLVAGAGDALDADDFYSPKPVLGGDLGDFGEVFPMAVRGMAVSSMVVELLLLMTTPSLSLASVTSSSEEA